MEEKLLPVEYRLEVYENSFVNDASLTIWSAAPLMAISVGDYFESRAHERWASPPQQGQTFRVKMVRHIVYSNESHAHHTVMLCVETVPLP